MPSPLADFRKIVFANTLRGCQLSIELPAEDLELIGSFVQRKELARGRISSAKALPAKAFTWCSAAR